MNTADVRALFPGLKDTIYLNTAVMAVGCAPAREAYERAVDRWAAGRFDWMEAERAGEDARGRPPMAPVTIHLEWILAARPASAHAPITSEGPMPEMSFAEQVATFNGVLREIEARVGTGEVGHEAVADFKSSVDDLRLRLWSILSTGSANDYRAFQERFRLRRAKEICRGLEDDLQAGALSPRHEELAPLGRAAGSLASRIEALSE